MRHMVRIIWHGHSCFTVDNGAHRLALDPYDPGMIGYPPLHIEAHAMLASHGHGDHNYQPAVHMLKTEQPVLTLTEQLPGPDDVQTASASASFLYRKVETCHDEASGSKRGRNTVHVILANGLRIVHLGDLGHLLSAAQIEAIGRPDLLLIPVGGYYTIDAAAACEVIGQLKPVNVAPMHYQIGYGNLPIAKVDPFLKLIADAGAWQINRLAGPVFDLNEDIRGQCCVFSYQP